MVGSRSLIDAAIVFGAERILSGAHNDPAWPYRSAFNREDDERLFRELLLQLALCDTLFLDRSSLSEDVPNEVFSLCRRINGDTDIFNDVGETGIIRVFRADENMDASPDDVQNDFCRYIGERVRTDEQLAAGLLTLQIPWAYHQPGHHDRGSMQWHIKSAELDQQYLPFLLFAWRGLLYGAIAHSERQRESRLDSYVAAPGRINALSRILVADDMERFDFPREAWRSLTRQLPTLPKRGYDFSFIRSFPNVDNLPISRLVSELAPKDALLHILDWRSTGEGHDLRSEWRELLDAHHCSAIVGSTNIQIAKNIYSAGDFNQTIIARPR